LDLEIHVDGGSRGNPGPAGAGVVIRQTEGTLVFEAGYFLGQQTNNAAEYQALIRALERAARCTPQLITVNSDSELLVRQILGQYQVKSPRLSTLYQRAQLLLLKMPRWMIRHVRREENSRADALANLAMDARRDVIVFDIDGAPADALADAFPPADEPVTDSAEGPDETHVAGPRVPRHVETGMGKPGIRVTLAVEPDAETCPARDTLPQSFLVQKTLPAELCVHAAHAILPTLLALLNTTPAELAHAPTLTVRCSRPGCGAVFQLTAVRGNNGVHPHG
jgi:ribonuclease HI